MTLQREPTRRFVGSGAQQQLFALVTSHLRRSAECDLGIREAAEALKNVAADRKRKVIARQGGVLGHRVEYRESRF
ncbi:MAG TPA: hypothetical protein VKR27_03945, partial [Acidimicrobiales bacterium]|nr:hypothetical protein [Acidimicrobiales bacterium]